MTTRAKESLKQMIKDKIVHLCKAHALYSGQIEIDGIICISGQVEGQELVVKVHEIFAAPHDLTSPYRSAATVGYPYIQRLIGDYPGPSELKRRRLESENDFKMAATELLYSPYSHLSKLIYNRSSQHQHLLHHPSAFTAEPGLDPQRNGVTDLSIKSLIGPAHAASSIDHRDNRSNRSLSPLLPPQQNLGAAYDVAVDNGSSVVDTTPIKSLLGPMFYEKKRRASLTNERWSPNKPLPTVPQCRLCGYKFESSELLSEHNEAVHSVFTCLCCFKTFTSRSNLERHSRLHTGHKPYACDICGKAFSRKDHLSNHSTKHAFKCGTCSKRYGDRNALISHCLYEHGSALTDVCSFCNKGFCSSDAYEEHLRAHPQLQQHIDESKDGRPTAAQTDRKYGCQNCSFESSDRVSYLKHRLVHSDGQRCYTCRACAKVFDDPLLYGDHLMLHRNETDVFECCFCRRVCGTLSSLRRHEAAHAYENDDNLDPTQTTTSGDELFNCNRCGKMFETYDILREHMEVHELVGRDVHLRAITFDHRGDLRRHVDAHGTALEVVCDDGNVGDDFCMEGVRNLMSRKDKRKQKQPKLVMSVQDVDGAEDDYSEIEVVEPESPGDATMPTTSVATDDSPKNGDSTIADNPTYVVQTSTMNDVEIKMEPCVRSIMNRPSRTSLTSVKTRDHLRSIEDNLTSSFVKQEASENEDFLTLFPSLVVCLDGSPALPPPPPRKRSKHSSSVRSILKRQYRRKRERQEVHDRSGRSSAFSYGRGSPNGGASQEDGVGAGLNNNNTIGLKNENHLSTNAAELPSGLFRCAVCGCEAEAFQQLENHCFAMHSRHPCMFCEKTFAQKANRDRHHCLHTGDKPYGCPDCDERFSRGDKLKMHRVRSHGIQYPAYGSRRGGDGGAPRDREFSASPPLLSSFFGIPSDGTLYFGGFASLPGGGNGSGNGPEIGELESAANSRPGSRVLVDDAIQDGVVYPSQVETPVMTVMPLMNQWTEEKQRSDGQMDGTERRPEDDDDDDGPESNKP